MLQLKRKAREAGEAEAGVTLVTGTDSEDDQGDQLEEAHIGHNDQESDEDAGGVYEGGLTSSDEDEQDLKSLQQAGASKAGQAAYFGMQKSIVSAGTKEYEGLSLAEQEALALKMIKS